jgi:hypothetical protein
VHYVAPAIESRTPVSALMTSVISGGVPPLSPLWHRSSESDKRSAAGDTVPSSQ